MYLIFLLWCNPITEHAQAYSVLYSHLKHNLFDVGNLRSIRIRAEFK